MHIIHNNQQLDDPNESWFLDLVTVNGVSKNAILICPDMPMAFGRLLHERLLLEIKSYG